MSLNKEIIGLLHVCEYLYFVVGNYLIDPHELIIHHVSTRYVIWKWLFVVLFCEHIEIVEKRHLKIS